jgi:hypothetical protein
MLLDIIYPHYNLLNFMVPSGKLYRGSTVYAK